MSRIATMTCLLDSLQVNVTVSFKKDGVRNFVVRRDSGGYLNIHIENQKAGVTQIRTNLTKEAALFIRMKEAPKLIHTELGTEKLCACCQEYWPLESAFFLWKWAKKVSGEEYKQYVHLCRDCYDERYGRKRVNQHRLLTECDDEYWEKKAA